MAGFFSKKQYAAIAERAFAIKLLNERCLHINNQCKHYIYTLIIMLSENTVSNRITHQLPILDTLRSLIIHRNRLHIKYTKINMDNKLGISKVQRIHTDYSLKSIPITLHLS